MSSLVLELQRDAQQSTVALPDVLRKARVVAVKLKVGNVADWLHSEMNGYPLKTEVPRYRQMTGEVGCANPVTGRWMPLECNADLHRVLSTVNARDSVGKLAETLATPGEYLHSPFSRETIEELRRGMDDRLAHHYTPICRVTRGQLMGIFDAVRNRVLDWSLELEANGIRGDGLEFTPREVQAATTQVNIGSIGVLNGVAGNAAGATVNVNDVGAILAAIKEAGLSADREKEVSGLVVEHHLAGADQRPGVARRMYEWTMKHANEIGNLAIVLKQAFGW